MSSQTDAVGLAEAVQEASWVGRRFLRVVQPAQTAPRTDVPVGRARTHTPDLKSEGWRSCFDWEYGLLIDKEDRLCYPIKSAVGRECYSIKVIEKLYSRSSSM